MKFLSICCTHHSVLCLSHPLTLQLCVSFTASLLQELQLDNGSHVQSCSVADPYILVAYESGEVVLLVLKVESEEDAKLVMMRPDLEQVRISAAILFIGVFLYSSLCW